MSEPAVVQLLRELLDEGKGCIGEVAITRAGSKYELFHRDQSGQDGLQEYSASDAGAIARFDDSGRYRPLKTAPNLRHDWKIVAHDLATIARALELLYPGRLAALVRWRARTLQVIPMRQTLARQTGMYRVAAGITDSEIGQVVGSFCRSDGGCLRTILWRRDEAGAMPSVFLPQSKFDPDFDQTQRGGPTVPLLCQEICPIVLGAARSAVKAR